MNPPSLLDRHVRSLPALVREAVAPLEQEVRRRLADPAWRRAARVFLAGCGDSHHACLAAELAFEELAGLPCEPMTAMQLARYAAAYLPEAGEGTNVAIAVSVSGRVARTAEALALARRAGATAVALTGDPAAPLAAEADVVLHAAVPAVPDDPAGVVVPGMRSYVVSQLVLYLCAIRLGELHGRQSLPDADALRAELFSTADAMARTIALSDEPAARLARQWSDADRFVWCGAGPNHGTALFAAAKLLEASGDAASGVDTEEWAHIEYFARRPDTPTFLIGAGGRDEDRALEVAHAAKAVGRRVAVVAPEGSALARAPDADAVLPTAVPIREAFSPLIACIPGALFAAHRARVLDEPYFRAFGGGRIAAGGGGASRIWTSHRTDRDAPGDDDGAGSVPLRPPDPGPPHADPAA